VTYRNDLEALAARKHALDVEVTNRTRERDEAARLLDEANARLRLPVLDNIRIAAPCKEDWSKMQGDDRVRHCTKCDQDVFNLSALTREQAESLIRDKRGELCARYFKRKDGTVITQDCPIGQRTRRRTTMIAAGALASLTAGAAYSEYAHVERTMGSIGASEEPVMILEEPIQGGVSHIPARPPSPPEVPREIK
jgi:hypothetical protein